MIFQRVIVGPEIAPRLAKGVIRGPMLVGQPWHLVRVPGEVRREVHRDHQVRVERHHAPRQGGIEKPGPVPCCGHGNGLSAVPGGAERANEVLDHQLEPAPHEGDLGGAHQHVHPASLADGTAPVRPAAQATHATPAGPPGAHDPSRWDSPGTVVTS